MNSQYTLIFNKHNYPIQFCHHKMILYDYNCREVISEFPVYTLYFLILYEFEFVPNGKSAMSWSLFYGFVWLGQTQSDIYTLC